MTAIYGRQSVDKGEQSLSIESQIEEGIKRLPKGEQHRIYKDKGYTGANINRPDFTRLLNDIKAGLITKVIIWKLDRISRSLLDFANIMQLFKQYNVAFESVTDNFDTSTPIGRAMLNIVMVFAQLERETIQMRVLTNYRKRAEKGFFLGGKSLYGLKKIPLAVDGYKTSTYELDPEYGEAILIAFDMYANTDISLGKLAKYLKNNNYIDPNDKIWDAKKLSRLLHNPTYVKSDSDVYQYYKSKGANIVSPIEDFNGNGLYLYGIPEGSNKAQSKFAHIKNRNIVVALHEGFVYSTTWLKVQYKLEKNIGVKNNGKGRHTWLSGIVKCGYCGYALTGQAQKAEHLRSTLRCTRRIGYGDCKGGSRLYIEDIESQVWRMILEKAQQLKDMQYKEQSKNDNQTNKLKVQIVKLEEQIENLLTALTEGNQQSIKLINKKLEELDTKRNELMTELQTLTIDNQEINTNEIIELIKEDLEFEERRQVARALIEKVLVYENNQLPQIQWRF